ncbi:3-deoxy-D-manno-octulosonic acid transferase [Litchfieldella qijiaojingensis]|uniref:3-deoxy-D-manno-octulosonic acid transferase n=1 Tax=Litchfieldella qijiaojingensis TaxID=980347 RepID=A0ABQ2YGU8_9GAMM|nr:lipid IV(A) 3-deoxy-D-manno-octulosonic acid transferase [Halomonas qijiaojingensis]GGX83904.1 3-deoxy-D-manno-octulosonic acid transferase [Halomonas qijiaojingensis]
MASRQQASRQGWARWLYSLALYALSPLVWRRVWREQALTHSRWQRLGWVPDTPAGRKVIWLHCASVGEVQAARPLIEALVARYPDRPLVLTTMTATGAERVQVMAESLEKKGIPGEVSHYFVPLDFPAAARRFVARLRPSLAIFFETELWPNLLRACERHGVPAVVVNGRLSPRAFEGYCKIRPLLSDALSRVEWLAAKSPADAERFQALGMAPDRISVVGSLKYDMTPDDESLKRSEHLHSACGERPVWVAGSTHPGEDEQLLEAHARLRETLPDALLLLVPRHPQRFDVVARLCQDRGMSVARRSRDELPEPHTAIYLGDTMGELLSFYGAADVAFVGGSLVPVGGHNLLEPAAMGVPVVTGPELANFSDVAETLREADALVEVTDSETLAGQLVRLFGDESERQRLTRAGQAVMSANRGALTRTLKGLECYL